LLWKEFNENYLNKSEKGNTDRFIIISKIVLMKNDENNAQIKKKKSKNKDKIKKKFKSNDGENSSSRSSSSSFSFLGDEDVLKDCIYLHPEDELFLKNSISYFFFSLNIDKYKKNNNSSVNNNDVFDENDPVNMEQRGLIILLDYYGVEKTVNSLYKHFNVEKLK
jgi:hypothetical protein